MKFELEIVRVDVADVITTSGCEKIFPDDVL